MYKSQLYEKLMIDLSKSIKQLLNEQELYSEIKTIPNDIIKRSDYVKNGSRMYGCECLMDISSILKKPKIKKLIMNQLGSESEQEINDYIKYNQGKTYKIYLTIIPRVYEIDCQFEIPEYDNEFSEELYEAVNDVIYDYLYYVTDKVWKNVKRYY